MPLPPGIPSDDPDKAALHWLIALEDREGGPEADSRRAAFEGWLAASPAHRAAWEEAHKVWHLLGDAAPSDGSRPRQTTRSARARHSQLQRPRRRLALATAAAALAACLLALVLPVVTLQLEADVVTAVGETRDIILTDGSRLHLGADSAVTIDYSAAARRISLLAGTIFVEVEPDPARRFTVAAGNLESSALGTAYEVRRLDSGTLVAVAHGSVAAEDSPARLAERLEAGDWLHVARDGTTARRGTSAPAEIAAWRDGRLAVKDWPLGDVVAALRHHFHGAIIVLGDPVAAQRVTGVYDLANPEAALRAAVYPAGAQVRAVTPWLLVVSPS
ncbi:FecR domain-containing protein [Pelagibius sp. 7325]|uniref:FecR family protein n=1 Tax=Pelagibius sp. 7325 TaxID=3131994 RepID=UPI0030EECAC8